MKTLMGFVNRVLIGCIIVIIIGLLAYHLPKLKVTQVPLEAKHWDEAPGLFVSRNLDNPKGELSIYRFIDGKPETLEGSWQYNFSTPSELFLFGRFAEDIVNSQKFYIVSPQGSVQKDISKLPGAIESVIPNPKQTYLLISGTALDKGTLSYYSCISEKFPAALFPCQKVLGDIIRDYSTTSMYKSFWNLKKERELVTNELGGENRTYLFDPWEEKPILVTSTEDGTIEEFKTHRINQYETKIFGNILSIKTEENKRKYFLIPFGSKVYWVDSSNILVVNRKKEVSLYDVRARTKSFVVDLPDNTTVATYYTQN